MALKPSTPLATAGPPKIKLIPSLAAKTPAAPVAKGTRKGPAFWSDATGATQKPRRGPLVSPARPPAQDKGPPPSKVFGAASRWQVSAVVLVLLALILFILLINLIGVYMWEADQITAEIPEMEGLENRLKEAVRLHYMGTNRSMACKPCQKKWLQWGDGCYLGTSKKMPWHECITYCQAYGASLLMAKTEGEMAFLLMETSKWLTEECDWRIPGSYWIGLWYNATDRIWRWVDGSYLHLRITKFIHEHYFEMDLCILFGRGSVIIRECNSVRRCLCKKEIQ